MVATVSSSSSLRVPTLAAIESVIEPKLELMGLELLVIGFVGGGVGFGVSTGSLGGSRLLTKNMELLLSCAYSTIIFRMTEGLNMFFRVYGVIDFLEPF